ncbi:hypothetical protein [Thiocystis violascens]|uniref:Uncharacterized protein n=1 Tax=Thiocystis violascens (strain ATCC 17096 / DSM 198 / 6111) TaxID=765911 RepID=I3Y6N2_THIV6|nr:hypothetical protein [Thiocystis violascens]AFL72650.1 hypothetical protein Thivi_0593 [Thiocystis violascens DSM 198]
MKKSLAMTADWNAIHSIQIAYTFQSTDQSWCVSKDIQGFSSVRAEFEERLVRHIAKSNKLAFTINRTATSLDIKTEQPFSQLVYDLLRLPQAHYPPMMEVSESSKIIAHVLRALNLNNINFTGDPGTVIGENGFLEGELINNIIIRIREAAKGNEYKTKSNERRKLINEQIRITERNIAKFFKKTPSLYVVRKTFCYKHDVVNNISLQETDGHLQRFINALISDLPDCHILGCWWKREYITEASYRYSVVIFINSSNTLCGESFVEIDSQWQLATDGIGVVCDYILSPYNGILGNVGSIGKEHDFYHSTLLSNMSGILKRDLYLRLKPHPDFKHFGMEMLSK